MLYQRVHAHCYDFSIYMCAKNDFVQNATLLAKRQPFFFFIHYSRAGYPYGEAMGRAFRA